MSEHTPGPWKVIEDPFSEGIVAIIQHDEFGLLAVGSCEDRAATGEEDHYNAHLIAAAPDLLAACEALLNVANDPSDCPYFNDAGTCTGGCHSEPRCLTDRPNNGWPKEQARAAIAKARGGAA